MKKLITTLSVMMLGFGAFTVAAQDTFDGSSLVLTPANGAITANTGADAAKTATLYWPGVKFNFSDLSEAPTGGYTLDGTKVTITRADGRTNNLQAGGFGDIGAGGSVVAFKEEDEDYDKIVINFPTLMGYTSYNGAIKVNVDAGLVTSTTGQPSPAVEFTYNYMASTADVRWDPTEDEATFSQGDPIVLNAQWGTYNVLSYGDYTELMPTVTQQNVSDAVAKDVTSDMVAVVDNKLQITLTSLNLTPGEYALSLPSSFVTVQGNRVSTTCTYHFTISSPVGEPTVSPESEETVNGFSKVIISWDGAGLKLNSDNTSEITFTLSSTDLLEEYSITPTLEFSGEENPEYEGDQIVLDLFSLPIVAGEYTLSIPAGYVMVAQESSDAAPNNAFSATYTLEIAYMDDAESVNTLVADDESYIGLSWDGATVYIEDANKLSIEIEFDGENYGTLSSEYVSLISREDLGVENGDSGTILYLPIDYCDPGEYTVTIPAGFLKNENGLLNPEQTLTVTAMIMADGSVSPASGNEFEQGVAVEFTITFDEALEMVEGDGADAPVVVSLSGDNKEENYTWANTDVVSIDGEVMTVNFGADLEPGDYTFTVAEGVVKAGDTLNKAIEDYAFTVKGSESDSITGLDSVKADAEIYNLQGLKVKSDKLVPGIYIINGKKVSVK